MVEDPNLIEDLIAANVTFQAKAPSNGLLTTLLGWLIPFLPLALIWYFFYKRMGQGGAQIMSIGKSKAQDIAGKLRPDSHLRHGPQFMFPALLQSDSHG
jgi:cell division protease FtsH